MSALPKQQNVETPADLELGELERTTGELCEHIEEITRDARARGELASRESAFQLEAFAERRELAQHLLKTTNRETYEIRISRLQRVVRALECSRAYFRPLQ